MNPVYRPSVKAMLGIQEPLKELTGIDVAGLLKDFAAKGDRTEATPAVKKETKDSKE